MRYAIAQCESFPNNDNFGKSFSDDRGTCQMETLKERILC